MGLKLKSAGISGRHGREIVFFERGDTSIAKRMSNRENFSRRLAE